MNTKRLSIARTLVACYVTLSVLSLIVLGILSAVAPHEAAVAAWIRGSIVAATGILMFVFATQAVRGSSRGLLRWRIVTAVMVVVSQALTPLSHAAPTSIAGMIVFLDPGHNGGNYAHASGIARPIFIGTQTRACDTPGTETNDGYTEAATEPNQAGAT